MANWQTIEETISDWVESASGLQQWFGYQSGPRPAAYVSVIIKRNIKKASVDRVVRTDAVGTLDTLVEVIPERELHVGVQTFTNFTVSSSAGRTALDYLSLIRDAASLDSNQTRFAGVGLAVYDASEVIYLPELLGEQWQSRASLDVIFGLTQDSVSERVPYVTRSSGNAAPNTLAWDTNKTGGG